MYGNGIFEWIGGLSPVAKTTLVGMAGGAYVGASLTVAGVAAKTGAIVGAPAGPAGALVGAAVGGAVGVTAYVAAKVAVATVEVAAKVAVLTVMGVGKLLGKLSIAVSRGGERKSRPSPKQPGERYRPTPTQRRRVSGSGSNTNRDGRPTGEQEGNGRDEDDDNRKNEEDLEESSDVSDFELQIALLIEKILNLPLGSPDNLRQELFRELCRIMKLIINNPNTTVKVNDDRSLSIIYKDNDGRTKTLVIPSAVREKIDLASTLNVGQSPSSDPIIYLIKCRHCPTGNYVGQTRNPGPRISVHNSVGGNNESNSVLAVHRRTHESELGINITFPDCYDIIIVREMPIEEGKQIKLRNWEVILQWACFGRQYDGGIGKR